MIDDCVLHGQEAKVGDAWIGGLFSPCAKMIIRENKPGHETRWLLPLGHIPNSSTVVYPVIELQVSDGVSVFLFERTVSEVRPCFRATVDHMQWKARPVKFVSPYGLWLHHRDAHAVMGYQRGVVLISTGEEGTLMEIASDLAFMEANMTYCHKLITHLGLDPPNPSSLHGCLQVLIQHFRNPSETDMVNILQQRIVSANAKEKAALTTFLNIEDAHTCFAPEDRENFSKARKSCINRIEEDYDFEKAWKNLSKKVKSQPAVADPGKGKGKGRGRAGKGGKAARKSYKPFPHGDLKQCDLKPWCPLGGFIWRANQAGAWCSQSALTME